MDLISIFTTLREKRLLAGSSLVVAIAIGVMMVYQVSVLPPHLKSKTYTVGAAVQNVLVDTPKSSAADLNPTGSPTGTSDSLLNQAVLLANLMLGTQIEINIAHQLGIPLNQLSVVNSATTGLPVIDTGLAATESSKLPPSKAYDLTIVANLGLPILTFQAQAPTPAEAGKLALAATTALKQYINNAAETQSIPQSQLTTINPLGPPEYGPAQRGPKKLYALVATLLTTVVLWSLIVFIVGLRRRARQGSAIAMADETWTPMPHGIIDFDTPQTYQKPVERDVTLVDAARDADSGDLTASVFAGVLGDEETSDPDAQSSSSKSRRDHHEPHVTISSKRHLPGFTHPLFSSKK